MRVVECAQYSPEWWDVRRGVPSCSNFGRIITEKTETFSPRGARTYAIELVGQKYDADYGMVEGYVSAAMKTGTIMEPEARRYYEFTRDIQVQKVGFVLTDCGRFGGSPDALVGEDGVLELKSPMAKTQVAYVLEGKLPDEYRAQCHGHLIVTGREWCDFLSYVGGFPPLLVRVERNDYTVKLRVALEQFWKVYEELDRRFTDQRELAIDAAIDRRGDMLPAELRSFV